MKKRFIKKKISWKKVFFNLQVCIFSPVLISLIGVNCLTDWLLQKWSAYRAWLLSIKN